MQQDLTSKGFDLKYDEKTKKYFATYEYSDFEILNFYVSEFIGANGKTFLKVEDLQMRNWEMYSETPHEDPEYYIHIGYDLYFKSIEEFLQLLNLLGYGIQ